MVNQRIEKIGNQEYKRFDTVYCVSLSGYEYSGFLYEIGNSSYVKVVRNSTMYEFRYHTINTTRKVLIEKYYKTIQKFEYEHESIADVLKFLKSCNGEI